jgi:general secretion pathway protein K
MVDTSPLKKNQSGVALIMVLLIIALATSLAVFITTRQSLWQQQIESQANRTQARLVGVAAIDWARAVLADDARTTATDNDMEIWAQRLPAMQVENGEVIGAIEDQQGLFNLNNLVRNGVTSNADVAQFQKLLALLGLPAELADTLADWMDADSETRPGGAEDNYYLSLPQPYRAANQTLMSVDELSLVKGYNSSVIAQLRPFVTALPQPGPINVNFAPPEVLAAVVGNLSLADARTLAQQRGGHPFKDVADFRQRLPQSAASVSDNDVTTSSQYFLVSGRASIGGAQVAVQALLQRITTVSTWPSVVWQSVQ